MKLPLVFAAGSTIFLLGIPTSLAPYPIAPLGNALLISGSIIIAACVIAHSILVVRF
jgi:hypothetical protein